MSAPGTIGIASHPAEKSDARETPDGAGMALETPSCKDGYGDAGSRASQGSEDALIQALANFIKDKTTPSHESNDKLGAKQHVNLALFFTNVATSYLVINSLLPNLVKAPVWHFLAQFAPVAVGGGFLVAGPKRFQKWLLGQARRTSFIFWMGGLFLVTGSAGLSQLPLFNVPVGHDADVLSFCVEKVNDIDDVTDAALSSATQSSQACPGGKLQSGGSRSLRSLQLAQAYMVAVNYQSRTDRYYLPAHETAKAFFKAFLGIESEPLSFKTVVLKIGAASTKERIKITRQRSGAVIYVPSMPQCSVSPEELQTFTCTLAPNATTPLRVMPGWYRFTLRGCKVQPPDQEVQGTTDLIQIQCT